MIVYVLNKHGTPLMPCSPRKARLLLKQHKAKAVKKEPFTIQLKYGSSGYKQSITLGVDAGSKHIGMAAVANDSVVYAVEAQPRNDVVKLLATRRTLRQGRRNRKTRYRPKQFDHRTKSKHKGWLAPSVEVKIQCHLTAIAQAYKLLPITKLIVETAEFDLQKLLHPDIQGVEYQQGEQLGYYNVKQYVFWRDHYTCQCCHGKSNDPKLHAHHIESRKTGGNAPNNLITLCETCHKLYHEGKVTFKATRRKSLRDAAFMGIMRKALVGRLSKVYPNVCETYGYITKATREVAMIPKSHINDAICIAGCPEAKYSGDYFLGKQVRKHNRQIFKQKILSGGRKKLNQAPYLIKGYRLFDMVKYNGQKCFIFGRRSSGYFDLRKLDGTKVSNSASYKAITLLAPKQNLLYEWRKQG